MKVKERNPGSRINRYSWQQCDAKKTLCIRSTMLGTTLFWYFIYYFFRSLHLLYKFNIDTITQSVLNKLSLKCFFFRCLMKTPNVNYKYEM